MKKDELCSNVQLFMSKVLAWLGFKKFSIVKLEKCSELNQKLSLEVRKVVRELEETRAEAAKERSELRESIAELAQRIEQENVKSVEDKLTQLYNCRFLEEMTLDIMANIKRSQKAWGVLYIDFDKFKQLNDTQGHHAGDSALAEIAFLFKDVSRDGDYIIRKGGDECVFIMLNVESEDDVVKLAERLRATAEEKFTAKYAITLSIGVCFVEGTDEVVTLDNAIKRADTAMYNSKRKGGNIVS